MSPRRHRSSAGARRSAITLAVTALGAVTAGALVAVAVVQQDATAGATASAPQGIAPTATASGPLGASGPASKPRVVVGRNGSLGRFSSSAPVAVLGDSLAVGIAELLATAWPQRTVTTDAAEGRRTAEQVQLLSSDGSAGARVWVVSLGTNDNVTVFAALAHGLLRAAGSRRCVVWFDVRRGPDDEALNATLRRLARHHSTLHVLPWHRLADANPAWFMADGIHPSGAGYRARAKLAVRAVERRCTSGP